MNPPPEAHLWTWGPLTVELPCDVKLRASVPIEQPGASFMAITCEGEPAWWGWFTPNELDEENRDLAYLYLIIVMPQKETDEPDPR